MSKLSEIKPVKIGSKPVVVVPLKKWEEIEDLLEDLEIFKSKKFKADIKKARIEKRIPFDDVLKKYNLD